MTSYPLSPQQSTMRPDWDKSCKYCFSARSLGPTPPSPSARATSGSISPPGKTYGQWTLPSRAASLTSLHPPPPEARSPAKLAAAPPPPDPPAGFADEVLNASALPRRTLRPNQKVLRSPPRTACVSLARAQCARTRRRPPAQFANELRPDAKPSRIPHVVWLAPRTNLEHHPTWPETPPCPPDRGAEI